MPNPKRRHSQQRSAKRRTHYKAVAATLSTDTATGELHVRHRAHVSEGKIVLQRTNGCRKSTSESVINYLYKIHNPAPLVRVMDFSIFGYHDEDRH